MSKKQTTYDFLRFLERNGRHLIECDEHQANAKENALWVILSEEFDDLWYDFKRQLDRTRKEQSPC